MLRQGNVKNNWLVDAKLQKRYGVRCGVTENQIRVRNTERFFSIKQFFLREIYWLLRARF